MKRLFLMLMCMTMCLVSCDDDDDDWNPRDDMAGWGYFQGQVNGDSVYLQNSLRETFTHHTRYDTYNYIRASRVDIKVPEKGLSYSFSLLRPELGTREIVNLHPENPYINDFDSFIGAKKGVIGDYEPKPEKPAKVKLTNLETKPTEGNFPHIHIIEGDVDAVLYLDNDSITIKGHFATK